MFGFVSTLSVEASSAQRTNQCAPIQRKTLDIITLFHKGNSPASARIVNLLKQASTNASQAANEATSAASTTREPFELDITEKAPTTDQVETILGYVDKNEIPQVVNGANSITEAMRKFKMDKDSFKTPMVSFEPFFLVCRRSRCPRRRLLLLTPGQLVDWSNGKVVFNVEESKILKLLQETKG